MRTPIPNTRNGRRSTASSLPAAVYPPSPPFGGTAIFRAARRLRASASPPITRGPRPFSRGAQVAQLVEQRIENPRVGGSIPPLGTSSFRAGTSGRLADAARSCRYAYRSPSADAQRRLPPEQFGMDDWPHDSALEQRPDVLARPRKGALLSGRPGRSVPPVRTSCFLMMSPRRW